MAEDIYRVKLDDIFEGPMDLLVHLIKKHEVDIYDIPIALITHQYLEYIEWMKQMNIDVAGDFIVLASTLTQIKSRMLVPSHEDDDDEEDPRMEIAASLEEYLRMKAVAEQLAGRDLLGESTFVRSLDKEDPLLHSEGEMIKIGLFELIDAFQKILENIASDEGMNITLEGITVKDRINEIVDILEKEQSVTFEALFSRDADKSQIIVTFLAILEMVKLNLIRVAQHVQTGIIRVFYL